MCNRYDNDKRAHGRILDSKTSFVYDIINPIKNGVAVCKDGDEFNVKTGIAVAYAKYLGEPIPKEI